MNKKCLLTVAILLVTGLPFAAQAQSRPFDLFKYFDRDVYAWGLFEARFGSLEREFSVLIRGSIEDDKLVLREYFNYTDGETQQRTWRITQTGSNTYEGRAADVKGIAIGTVKENVLTWKYALNLKTSDRNIVVTLDDKMYLQKDGSMINRASMSKWGVNVGEISLFFLPAEMLKNPQIKETEFHSHFIN
jgi:hypothetical protein